MYPLLSYTHLLLRHRIHSLRAHRRRSHRALVPPSQLASRPALAKAALGRHSRTDRIATDVLHKQRRREAQAKSSAALTNLDVLYTVTMHVRVFASGSLPHLFHAVFALFGPCLLYSSIVLYYLLLYIHDRES